MPDTRNHAYNAPERGTEDWHEPLNENWEDLDVDVEVRDDEDRREQYTPEAGAKYLATDTGAVFIGDGDSWNRLGTIDTGGSTGSQELDTGTITHTGGSATQRFLRGVTDDETSVFQIVLGPETAPGWDAEYGFNYDWERRWDEQSGQIDVLVSVHWGPDPGAGNDLELRYSVRER